MAGSANSGHFGAAETAKTGQRAIAVRNRSRDWARGLGGSVTFASKQVTSRRSRVNHGKINPVGHHERATGAIAVEKNDALGGGAGRL